MHNREVMGGSDSLTGSSGIPQDLGGWDTNINLEGEGRAKELLKSVYVNGDGLIPAKDINIAYGYIVMVVTIVTFHFVNVILKQFPCPEKVTEKPWRLRNLFISWLHALIVGPWAALW